MDKVVVTGASGFIGGCLLHSLLNDGVDAYGIGRRSFHDLEPHRHSGTKQRLPSNRYVQQDLSQPFSKQAESILSGSTVIVHAAARSSPWGTNSQYKNDNIIATEKLIEWCQRNGVPKFVFLSSSSVYYEPKDQIGITEQTPLALPPINRYAETKQLGERLVRRYRGPWVILRPRAVYGPGDTILFPRILAAAKAGRLPLLYRDGTPVVGDLIFVDNLVNYIKKASLLPVEGDFNLTDNSPVEIIAFLMSIFDRLKIAKPTKRLKVGTAHRIAYIIELLYKVLSFQAEPPITRFGVHVFAYSKTFDVSKMLSTFSPPPETTEQGVTAFVDWIENENPYGNI